MSFQIKKILTEVQNIKSHPDIASSNMSKNYQDIEGEKSSTEGFICKNMYIAKIEDNSTGKLEFHKFL